MMVILIRTPAVDVLDVIKFSIMLVKKKKKSVNKLDMKCERKKSQRQLKIFYLSNLKDEVFINQDMEGYERKFG